MWKYKFIWEMEIFYYGWMNNFKVSVFFMTFERISKFIDFYKYPEEIWAILDIITQYLQSQINWVSQTYSGIWIFIVRHTETQFNVKNLMLFFWFVVWVTDGHRETPKQFSSAYSDKKGHFGIEKQTMSQYLNNH